MGSRSLGRTRIPTLPALTSNGLTLPATRVLPTSKARPSSIRIFPQTTCTLTLPELGSFKYARCQLDGNQSVWALSPTCNVPYLPPLASSAEYGAPPGWPRIFYLQIADRQTWSGQTLTISFTHPAHGTVTENGNGTFSYTADSDYEGPDSFQYTVNNQYTISQPATVTMLVCNAPALSRSGATTGALYSNQVVPIDDAVNADGVPGFADGYQLYGTDYADEEGKFIPLFVWLPTGFDVNTGQIKVTYTASDPAAVTRSGAGTDEDPYQYALPQDGGALRIWSRGGVRTSQSFGDYRLGYQKPSGNYSVIDMVEMDLAILGNGGIKSGVLLYIERVRPSLTASENTIAVSFDPNGSGTFSNQQTINVCDPPILDSDAMNVNMQARVRPTAVRTETRT